MQDCHLRESVGVFREHCREALVDSEFGKRWRFFVLHKRPGQDEPLPLEFGESRETYSSLRLLELWGFSAIRFVSQATSPKLHGASLPLVSILFVCVLPNFVQDHLEDFVLLLACLLEWFQHGWGVFHGLLQCETVRGS